MSPQAGLALGIDVSHHRGRVDWRLVKDDGVSFGIVKTSDGGHFIDPTFDFNWTQMRHAGLIRGAYHFFRPAVDPVDQAQLYLSMVGNILHESDLPPVLDVEAYPSYVREEYYAFSLAERLNRIRQWLDVVAGATDRVPMIYTNQNTWQATLGNTQDFRQFPLWVANYGVQQPNLPAGNWGGNGWTFWQYSSTGEVAGVNGGLPPVDLNVYEGSEEELRNWLGISAPRPLPPAVTNAQMLNAVRKAAEDLGVDPDDLVARLKFEYLGAPASNRSRPYDGPGLDEMPLNEDEKWALVQALQAVLDGPEDNPLEALSNQDVINAFYRAADLIGVPGWTLIDLADLEWLVNDRQAAYTGPSVEEMTGLSDNQKAALREVLGLTQPVEEPDDGGDTEEPYPGLTNQMMINAFYEAAASLGMPGWTLITIAGLTDLVDNRQGIYMGPGVGEMSGLDDAQKAALAQALGLDSPNGDEFTITYPGLVNQDMINIFYRAAGQFNQNGWSWIARAQLEYIAETRTVRYEPYRGPKIEDMQNLTGDEKDALVSALNTFQNN